MSSDKKKLDWASPADEQDTFGSQSPYAAPSAPYLATPYNNSTQPLPPTAPPESSIPFTIPVDAPPMYTKDPVSKPPAPQAARPPQGLPSSSAPHLPQQPYQYQPPQSQPQYQPPPHPPQGNVAYLPPQGSPPPLQRQPHGDQYQPLLAPQHPQPQQYYPNAINYGATPNPNNGCYPAPRGPPNDRCDSDDDRRIRRRYKKRKKRCSCCTCCCLTLIFIIFLCLYFNLNVTFGGGSCFIGDDSEPVEFNQLIPASQDLALKFQALDGITGNILVKESESNTDTNIRIHTLMRASSSKLLDQLEQSLFLDSKTSARVSVHINDRNDKETKRRLTHENCARADVEIIYPRGRPGTGKLHLGAMNGQFNIMMGNITSISSSSGSSSSSAGSLAIFEELRMGLMNGEVNLGGVTVSTKVLVEVTNGHILGHINSAGTVVAQIINGPIDLSIDSEPKRDDWDANNLHVTINTVNGRIGLNLVRRFLGHFSLSTTLHNPATIRHINPTTDNIKYVSRSSSGTKGWISKDGEEPVTSSRLDLGTVNGNILVEVDTFKKQ